MDTQKKYMGGSEISSLKLTNTSFFPFEPLWHLSVLLTNRRLFRHVCVVTPCCTFLRHSGRKVPALIRMINPFRIPLERHTLGPTSLCSCFNHPLSFRCDLPSLIAAVWCVANSMMLEERVTGGGGGSFSALCSYIIPLKSIWVCCQ